MKQKKYAQHFFKLELIKFNIEVFQNESGNNQSDFIIKTEKDIYHEVYLRHLNLEKESSIQLFREEIKKPKENYWIALVLIMNKMESSLYLIPSILLLDIKEYPFLEKLETDENYWKINVFLDAIPALNKFSIANISEQL
jgi:hypothetical protein